MIRDSAMEWRNIESSSSILLERIAQHVSNASQWLYMAQGKQTVWHIPNVNVKQCRTEGSNKDRALVGNGRRAYLEFLGVDGKRNSEDDLSQLQVMLLEDKGERGDGGPDGNGNTGFCSVEVVVSSSSSLLVGN